MTRIMEAFGRKYMRIRVLINVRKPLKISKKIKKQSGEAHAVHFKYEILGSFCYLCGKLGHVDYFCELILSMGHDTSIWN